MSYASKKIDKKTTIILKTGGVGVLPSDTIYGLSCQALDKKAVTRIYQLKGRETTKPVIVLISDLKMLDMLSIDHSLANPVKDYWPGRLSVIFPAPNTSAWLTRGSQSLAVRWPADQQLCALIDQVGPIVSTSANTESKPPAKNIDEAKSYFGDKPDFYVDIGELDNPPSTVAKLAGGRLELVRQGAVVLK